RTDPPSRTEGWQARPRCCGSETVKEGAALTDVRGAAPPPPSVLLGDLRPAAAAERLLERQADADVLVALAELVDDQRRVGAVGAEQQAVPLAEHMVDVERHRGVRGRPIFDERVPPRRAVEVRIELVGAEEGG